MDFGHDPKNPPMIVMYLTVSSFFFHFVPMVVASSNYRWVLPMIDYFVLNLWYVESQCYYFRLKRRQSNYLVIFDGVSLPMTMKNDQVLYVHVRVVVVAAGVGNPRQTTWTLLVIPA